MLYRLYIVDDEPSVIEGLGLLIDWFAAGFTICGSSDNGENAWNDILRYRPHVILTDIRMPNMDGLTLIEKARSAGCDVRFVILSGYGNFEYAQKALHNKVRHFLLKPLNREEIEEIFDDLKMEMDAAYGEDSAHNNAATAQSAREDVARALELMDKQALLDATKPLFSSQNNGAKEFVTMSYKRFISQRLMDDILYDCFTLLESRNIGCDVLLKQLTEKWYPAQEVFLKVMSDALSLLIAERKKESKPHLYDVRDYILANLTEDITVKSLSEQFFLDSNYLGNAFRKQFNQSIKDFINQQRINKAIALMEGTEKTVNEIALECGYNNYNHFYKMFERFSGTVPSQYKRQSTTNVSNELSAHKPQ